MCCAVFSHWVSYSLSSYGLQPTRLLCPGDSPDKNTAVGSLSLLQGIFPTQDWTQVFHMALHFLCVPTKKRSCEHLARWQLSGIEGRAVTRHQSYRHLGLPAFRLWVNAFLFVEATQSMAFCYGSQTNTLLMLDWYFGKYRILFWKSWPIRI